LLQNIRKIYIEFGKNKNKLSEIIAIKYNELTTNINRKKEQKLTELSKIPTPIHKRTNSSGLLSRTFGIEYVDSSPQSFSHSFSPRKSLMKNSKRTESFSLSSPRSKLFMHKRTSSTTDDFAG
jgi:hypothetical protein